MLKFTYWWCQDLTQWQIKQQLELGSHTAVDWDIFGREVCEVALFDGREKIEGPEIDESKIDRRKYHRGHVVEVSGFSVASRKIHASVLLRQ